MHGSYITLSTCQLNQWSLDFDGNCKRIIESCKIAKENGSSYRLGPELEISGYGCEDHFLEQDTIHHCWESIIEIINSGATHDDLLCDFGMPVLFQNVRYNCRILVLNGIILLIRPKTVLADNGNYRESRWFTAWDPSNNTKNSQFTLPSFVLEKLNNDNHPHTVPFGLSSIKIHNTTFGCESCEELWSPFSTHIDLSLKSGIEIIGNGSGSHHELRKLHKRIELICNATSKCGGIYLYSNQRGCDGGRLYYDGCSMIVVNGDVVAQASQFSLLDVEVITATIDLNSIQSYRASLPSFGIQAQRWMKQNHNNHENNILVIDHPTTTNFVKPHGHVTPALVNGPHYHTPEEECCLGPACWLWDYLRRSGASGYFLPLSGGADSSSVATIVGCMCHLVMEACHNNNDNDSLSSLSIVQKDVLRIIGNDNEQHFPKTSQELANIIFHTCFLGSENSSIITKLRSQNLGNVIGSYHLNIEIDPMVKAVLQVFKVATNGYIPKFTIQGGTMVEDLALQNIQARLRMIFSYLLAQLLPWVRSRGSGTGFLLVLGSSNVDEGLRGYMTKYDCSSADINPIGGISKGDLKRMLLWASTKYPEYNEILNEIANAPPTAELRPKEEEKEGEDNHNNNDETTTVEHSQLDEEEMGMTYEELGWFGRLRKIHRCGPMSMFLYLTQVWGTTTTRGLSWKEIAIKVQRFFRFYSINRHKMCTLTPSYHAEAYGPDDNRFDLRQFLYNTTWSRQFRTMNELVQEHDEKEAADGAITKEEEMAGDEVHNKKDQ